MKNHTFTLCLLLLAAVLFACNNSTSTEATDSTVEEPATLTTSQLADSIRYFRDNYLQTDIVSRHIPDLERQQAFDLQLDALDKELAKGAKIVGWKMGGTATDDAAKFDPVFGYILNRFMVGEDHLVNSKNFPGGSILVEGEIGFVIKNDLKDGVASKEALMEQIDYVVGAVELAQATAIPISEGPLDLNYLVATGMGQVGTIQGDTRVAPQDFDLENETVKCYVNGELAAEGTASNIFGNPLNALYELANLLPTQDRYLRAGDLVITGSIYQNPTVDGPAEVKLEFSSLGEIAFKVQ